MTTITPSRQALIETGKLRSKMDANRAAYKAEQLNKDLSPQGIMPQALRNAPAALGVGRNVVDAKTVGNTANELVTRFPYQNPQYKEGLGKMFPGYAKGGVVKMKRGGVFSSDDLHGWLNEETIPAMEESPRDKLFREKSNNLTLNGGMNELNYRQQEVSMPETYKQNVLSGMYDEDLMYAKGGEAKLGIVKGPGTATSDSIPAKLSAGEFVVPANVVSAYGVDYFNNLVKKVTGEVPPPPDVSGGDVKAAFGFSPGGIFNPYTDKPEENDINNLRENIGAGVRGAVETVKNVPAALGNVVKAIDEQGYKEGEQYRKGFQGRDFVPNASQQPLPAGTEYASPAKQAAILELDKTFAQRDRGAPPQPLETPEQAVLRQSNDKRLGAYVQANAAAKAAAEAKPFEDYKKQVDYALGAQNKAYAEQAQIAKDAAFIGLDYAGDKNWNAGLYPGVKQLDAPPSYPEVQSANNALGYKAYQDDRQYNLEKQPRYRYNPDTQETTITSVGAPPAEAQAESGLPNGIDAKTAGRIKEARARLTKGTKDEQTRAKAYLNDMQKQLGVNLL